VGTPEGGGFERAITAAPDTATVWNEFRMRGSAATLVVLVSLGFMWDWGGAFLLALIAAVSVFDAVLRRRGLRTQSLFSSVALDQTLIGVGILIIDFEPLAIGTPYLYMMAVPLLLLPLRQGLVLVLYATAWAVASMTTVSVLSIPDVDPNLVAAVAFGLFATLLLALIGVVAVSLDQNRKVTEQRLRNESALTLAGRRLLSESDESALIDALEAIRIATGAQSAFVGENKGNAKTGPAALVTQVSGKIDQGSGPSSSHWTLPYMRHREIAAAMARKEAVRLDHALDVATGGGRGEVLAIGVPVSVEGEWAGFLGVAYSSADGPAPEPDLQVLETIAAMIGAFRERQIAYGRLEQLIRSKDQFLASVSHEIRTPLTSVLGFASVLKAEPDQLSTADGREIVDLIQNQALEVADLVEDLLVAARAEIDAISVLQIPVSLKDEIQSVLSARLGSNQSDIFVATNPNHRAIADPTRVRQIIRNLLTNALRYGGEQITITTHRDGPEVLVVFSDNGEGVPQELRRRVFDPYESGDPAKAAPDSIGLGLAVSRQLARLMDGDLTLRADLGGATFQLSLPMATREDDGEEPLLPDGAVVIGNEVHISVSPSDWGIE
jgi:signal transduction histidine kinase